MHLTELVAIIVLLALLVLSIVVSGRRLQLLRRGGTPVVVRSLPAAPGRGWRHGVMRYREECLVFFRISSLRLGPDRRIHRRSVVVLGRRRAQPSERDVVPVGATVVHFRDHGGESEVALGPGALTAFLSWVESSPPGRAERSRR